MCLTSFNTFNTTSRIFYHLSQSHPKVINTQTSNITNQTNFSARNTNVGGVHGIGQGFMCDCLSLRLLYLTSPDTWSQGPPSECVIFNLPDSSANDQKEPKQR